MMAIGIIGFLGFSVCIIGLIVSAIKKKGTTKKWGIGIAVFLVAFVSSAILEGNKSPADQGNQADNTAEITQTTMAPTIAPPTAAPTLSPEEKAQLAEAEAQKAHDDWVESQFSAWDGSHNEFVRLVKENMNDPKSFEHVETKYLVLSTQEQIDEVGKGEIGDLYIYMKFRGTNAFGGKILSEAEGLASYKKQTITILNEF